MKTVNFTEKEKDFLIRLLALRLDSLRTSIHFYYMLGTGYENMIEKMKAQYRDVCDIRRKLRD